MKISVCLTLFNEEESIGKLIDGLFSQSRKPDEIVIVDGGSRDNTVKIVRHWQKRDRRVKLLVQKCTRAEGRNLGVDMARNEIVAITDGDCIPHKNWLKRITLPFKEPKVDMVAGFYHMVANSSFEKALSYFLAVTPRRFSINFLPSTRSIAFRKSLWERVGGFPEAADNSAEDTDFNYKVVKLGAGIAREKDAIVYWKIPNSLKSALKKFYDYAKWDAKNGLWWHPIQKFESHNIKALLILFRYLLGLSLLILSYKYPLLLPILLILFFIYLIWSYRKVYLEFRDWKTSAWGPPIQLTSDIAVMAGFISGLISQFVNT